MKFYQPNDGGFGVKIFLVFLLLYGVLASIDWGWKKIKSLRKKDEKDHEIR